MNSLWPAILGLVVITLAFVLVSNWWQRREVDARQARLRARGDGPQWRGHDAENGSSGEDGTGTGDGRGGSVGRDPDVRAAAVSQDRFGHVTDDLIGDVAADGTGDASGSGAWRGASIVPGAGVRDARVEPTLGRTADHRDDRADRADDRAGDRDADVDREGRPDGQGDVGTGRDGGRSGHGARNDETRVRQRPGDEGRGDDHQGGDRRGSGQRRHGEGRDAEGPNDGKRSADPGTDATDADEDALTEDDVNVEHSITLQPGRPVAADRLLVLTSSMRHIGGKPIRIEAQRESGQWEALQSGGAVVRVRFSVLLANRRGPLTQAEIADFDSAVGGVAQAIDAPIRATDMGAVLERARQLDTLAAALDTQIDLMVETPSPMTVQQFTAMALSMGLRDRSNQRFVRTSQAGEVIFTLMPGRAPDLLEFIVDVPRTPERYGAWRAMIDCANQCAKRTGGRVVDGTGRGMSVGMIEQVERHLDERYEALRRMGLRAGSAAALRVFS